MDHDELDHLRLIAGLHAEATALPRRLVAELLAVYDAADALTRVPVGGEEEGQARQNLEVMMGVGAIRP